MKGLNPILITILFALIISDARINFSHSFIAMIPVAVYMILYIIMVFVLGVWTDYYKTNAFFPWPVSLVLTISVSFGIGQLLRLLHNLTNKHVSKRIERYYKESPGFEFPIVADAIAHLAELESKFYYEGDDVYILVDIIHMLAERYNAVKIPVDILYDVYLEHYLINIGKKAKQ